jgi:hypothetical protein
VNRLLCREVSQTVASASGEDYVVVKQSVLSSPLSALSPSSATVFQPATPAPKDVTALCTSIKEDVNLVASKLVWLTQLPQPLKPPSQPSPTMQSLQQYRVWRILVSFVHAIAFVPKFLFRAVKMVKDFVWGSSAPFSIGGLAFHRSALLSTKHARQLWVKVPAGYKIDAVLIPSEVNLSRFADASSTHTSIDTFRAADGTAPPLVILCNPNAGLYEHSGSSNEWLDFYGKLGFNVVIFNYGCDPEEFVRCFPRIHCCLHLACASYRGYSRSEGYPYPEGMHREAVALLAHIKAHFPVGKVIAHGESIGVCGRLNAILLGGCRWKQHVAFRGW